MELIIFLSTLFISLIIGVPIAMGLLFSAVAVMLSIGVFDSQIIGQHLIDGMNNYSLLAIPLFILAGELINRGGITDDIVKFAMSLMGHIKGGLGYVVVLASIIFAGISGSAIADTAALGAVLIPLMASHGYDKKYATGIVASSGIIATVIPPSIPLIIIGVTAGLSITKLFVGGIVPGILMGVGIMITWKIISRNFNDEIQDKASIKEVLMNFKNAIWALLLPVIIIGGLRGGVFTPTEGGAIVSFYALFIGIVIYKKVNLLTIYESLVATAKTTSIVMFIIATASVSAWVITVANIPSDLISLLGPVSDNALLLLLIINILLILIGMVMDIVPAILIFFPVLLPTVTQAGIDPIYFGILVAINLSIGLITPPVGTVLYVAGGVGDIKILDVIKGVFPFLIAHLIVLIILILFPQIVTYPIEWFG